MAIWFDSLSRLIGSIQRFDAMIRITDSSRWFHSLIRLMDSPDAKLLERYFGRAVAIRVCMRPQPALSLSLFQLQAASTTVHTAHAADVVGTTYFHCGNVDVLELEEIFGTSDPDVF